MAWTEDRVKILTKLWQNGWSGSQIAKKLGGATRNAVIGKADRLGLKHGSTQKTKKQPKKPKGQSRVKSPKRRTTCRRGPRVKHAAVPYVVQKNTDSLEPKRYDGEYLTTFTVEGSLCREIMDKGIPPNIRPSDVPVCGRKTAGGETLCSQHLQRLRQNGSTKPRKVTGGLKLIT